MVIAMSSFPVIVSSIGADSSRDSSLHLVPVYAFCSFFYSQPIEQNRQPGDIEHRGSQALRHYSAATGIPCARIDDEGTLLFASGRDSVACPICSLVSERAAHACLQTHLYGSFCSLRFGGRYTYFCPNALTFFSAPLLIDRVPSGSLIAGPVLLIDVEEYIQDEIDGRLALESESRSRAIAVVRSIPRVTPERAHALAEQLLYTASWATGAQVTEIIAEQEEIRAEADISSYMSHLKTMGGGSDADTYPDESERLLLSLIREGDRDGARELLAQLLARVRIATGNNVDAFRLRALELAVLLSRAAIDGGAEPESVFGINYGALAHVQHATSVHDLSTWLIGVTERFVSFVFDAQTGRHREVFLKARSYVRLHASEKVALSDVADAVGLSPAYLSRLFKEEMGITFVSYLARVRVEAAKGLLKNATLGLAEVATTVGFADQSHFTRVFKRVAGISPARYRSGERVSEQTHELHQ
ncbi:MAG: helix-turn-helix domain-containing protein [Spirochaetota bacterium]